MHSKRRKKIPTKNSDFFWLFPDFFIRANPFKILICLAKNQSSAESKIKKMPRNGKTPKIQQNVLPFYEADKMDSIRLKQKQNRISLRPMSNLNLFLILRPMFEECKHQVIDFFGENKSLSIT